MSRKQTNWHQLTAGASVRLLRTDAAAGLSRKMARTRLKKEGASEVGASDIGRWLKRFASAPLFLILTVSSVLALFFGEPKEGGSILLFLAFFAIFVSRIVISIMQTNALTNYYKVPMARVLRQGKNGFVFSGGVVPGDILLLKSGDVVPCRCRLLRAKNLVVSLVVKDPETGHRHLQILNKKAETVYPCGDFTPEIFCENMLATGSVIKSGIARAVAVENGSVTDFSKPLGISSFGMPKEITGYYSYLRYAEIMSLLLIMLHTVLGILILPESISIMRIFLPICSLTLAGSAVIPTLFLYAFWSSAKHRCFKKKNQENRCVFQSFETLERVPGITDLVIIGHEALSDGILHYYCGLLGEKATSATHLGELKGNSVVQAIGEALHYLDLGLQERNSVGGRASNPYHALLEEWLKRTDFDREGSDVRLKHLHCPPTEKTEVVEAQLQDATYRYAFVSEDFLSYCDYRLCEDGSITEISKSDKERICKFENEMTQRGCHILSVLREKEEKVVLLGVLALREDPIKNLSEKIESLESDGVRVTIFLNPTEAPQTPFAAFTGFTVPPITKSDLALSDRSFEEFAEKYRVFWDIPREKILSWVRSLGHTGYRVACVGNSVEDAEILSASQLRIACDGTYYHSPRMRDGIAEGFPETTVSGGTRCPDVLRKDADLLVPRGNTLGGGIQSILSGFRICKDICGKIMYLIPMLAACLLFRLLVLCGCILSGIGLPQGFWLLWCGVGLDCSLYLALSSAGITNKRKDTNYIEAFRMPSFWIRPIFSAITLIFILKLSIIMGWIDVSQSLTLVVTLLIPMQLFLLPAGASESHPAWWRLVLAFLVPFLPLLVCLLFSAFFPSMDLLLGFGTWNKTMQLIPFMTLLLVGIVTLPAILSERVRKR